MADAPKKARGGLAKPVTPSADLAKIVGAGQMTRADVTKKVWDYIKANGVPYNDLHDQNFPSIGCAPCTRAIQPGEDVRAGRWWWENPDSKECGLHR